MGLRFLRSGRAGFPAVVMLAATLLAGWSSPAGAGASPPSLRAEVRPEDLTAADLVVEPGASLSPSDGARLEDSARRLRAQGVPTKFVVVATRPPDTGAGEYARELRRAAGLDGNLLVLFLSPGSLGLASTRVPDTELDAAFAAERPRLAADSVGGTIAVAERLASAATIGPESLPASEEGSVAEEEPGGGSGGDRGGQVAGGLVILAGLGFGGYVLVRSSRRAKQRRFDETRAAMEPMVDALATQVDGLWQEISEDGERAEAAHGAWDEAAQAQLAAREKLRRATGEGDLSTARLQIERGLRAAQRAQAALEGRPVPDGDAPLLSGLCAFDPGHGPAVDAVPVTTPKGDTADVPACAACADQLAQGATPAVRRVPSGGRSVPYWQGAGWGGGGMMPSFGGFLGGLFLADLLFDSDHGMGGFAGDHGGGWDGGDYGGDAGDGGDSSGGGDYGGGDWG
ncbi:MAG: hypothetical protein M3357_07990, partial [Actinomycetota bacterium]|nr:hypothetical protein [Actinomycetota bacterium]